MPYIRVLLLCLLLPFAAAAAAPSAFEEGTRFYEALDYERAATAFEKVLDDETVEAATRARAAAYLGVIRLVLGEEQKAREAFATALRIDPEVALPTDASPAVQAVLEEVRRDVSQEAGETGPAGEGGPPGESASTPTESKLLRHTPPEPGTGPARIEVTLDPLREVEVDRIVVYHRRGKDDFWFTVDATPLTSAKWVAELPAPTAEAPIAYYIEALDPNGVVVGRVGSRASPLLVRTPEGAPLAAVDAGAPLTEEGPEPPWYQRWYLWAGVGAVAAVLVGGIVLANGGGCPAPSGQGCVEVTLR
ncbi:MAG: tetratricopeptide repeat protein [Deltaproteobacteria bacterium]|nr:MAG: tetratricopeptide repeat protein [Deltaproteobacteria bacterium]